MTTTAPQALRGGLDYRTIPGVMRSFDELYETYMREWLNSIEIRNLDRELLAEGDCASAVNGSKSGSRSGAGAVVRKSRAELTARLNALFDLLSGKRTVFQSKKFPNGYVAMTGDFDGVGVAIMELGENASDELNGRSAVYLYLLDSDGNLPEACFMKRSKVLSDKPQGFVGRVYHGNDFVAKVTALLRKAVSQ